MTTSTNDRFVHDVKRRARHGSWKMRALAVLTGLALLPALLFVGEFAARVCCPHVNYQDTDKQLLGEAPGLGYFWRPGREGVCFGQAVRIDEHGCRDLEFAARATDEWLVLGDSVAFGVGVPAAETFAGRVQRAAPQVRVRNTAVVGMNLDGQLAVARAWLARDAQIKRITLFYCLNDLEGTSGGSAEPGVYDQTAIRDLSTDAVTWRERLLGFLRSRSKLYLLAKGVLADRGETYFRCDRELYREGERGRLAGLDRLGEIAALAAAHGVPFDVVILPYEYQLRVDSPDVWEPQQQLDGYLTAHSIAHVDARDWFASSAGDARRWFLFGDPMHLSSDGHQVVAERWLESGPNDAPVPHLTARPVDHEAADLPASELRR